jgi:hypothetical protein
MGFAARLSLLLAFLAAPLCAAAQAADYEVGTSLVCNAQTEVERFVALFAGDAQSSAPSMPRSTTPSPACSSMSLMCEAHALAWPATVTTPSRLSASRWSASTAPLAFKRSSRPLVFRFSTSRNTQCKPYSGVANFSGAAVDYGHQGAQPC